MERTLNKITAEDYLLAQGAQMMLRLLCDIFEHDDMCFYHKNADGTLDKAKATPYQLLDAIRRHTAGIINMDNYLRMSNDLVLCPVWGKKKNGKATIERIDIKRRQNEL